MILHSVAVIILSLLQTIFAPNPQKLVSFHGRPSRSVLANEILSSIHMAQSSRSPAAITAGEFQSILRIFLDDTDVLIRSARLVTDPSLVNILTTFRLQENAKGNFKKISSFVFNTLIRKAKIPHDTIANWLLKSSQITDEHVKVLLQISIDPSLRFYALERVEPSQELIDWLRAYASRLISGPGLMNKRFVGEAINHLRVKFSGNGGHWISLYREFTGSLILYKEHFIKDHSSAQIFLRNSIESATSDDVAALRHNMAKYYSELTQNQPRLADVDLLRLTLKSYPDADPQVRQVFQDQIKVLEGQVSDRLSDDMDQHWFESSK